jgi:hypothetical protein
MFSYFFATSQTDIHSLFAHFSSLSSPSSASGAAAKPFITHHNDFDTEFYLRIAFETALKKATV